MGAAIETPGIIAAICSTLEAFLPDHEFLENSEVSVTQYGTDIRIEINGFGFYLALDDPAPAPFDLSLLPAEPFTTQDACRAIDPTRDAVSVKQMARALSEAGYVAEHGRILGSSGRARFWRRAESKS
jgi:hypothetical protein